MDLNNFSFTGRLGAEPEMRYTPEGTPVTKIRVAISLAKEKTLWLDVTAWGKTAEACNQYLAKGSQVAVNGRLELDEWEDESGNRRQKHRVTANTITFLGSKKDSGTSPASTSVKESSDIDDLLAEGFDDDDFKL